MSPSFNFFRSIS